MTAIFRIIALLCIWTTPFQIFFILWGTWIVIDTENTFFNLTVLEFISQKLNFLIIVIDWLYSWFWQSYLDFVLSLPLLLVGPIKALASLYIGFWILKKID